MNDQFSLSVSEACDVALLAAHARVPVILEGPPGVGKSSIAHKIGRILNLPVFDKLRASQIEALDLRGLPNFTAPDEHGVRYTTFCPPAWLPRKPSIFFIDEFTAATMSVKVACYQLLLEWSLGDYNVPQGTVMILAGNRRQDGAGATAENTASANRMMHITIREDFASFEQWALTATSSAANDDRIESRLKLPESVRELAMDRAAWEQRGFVLPEGAAALALRPSHAPTSRLLPETYLAGIHPLVLAYLRKAPDQLSTFASRSPLELAFASPRTWELASRVLHASDALEAPHEVRDAALIGTLGSPTATGLLAYLGLAESLPDLAQIIADPAHAPIPRSPDACYALCALMAHAAKSENLEALLHYGTRFENLEFSALFSNDLNRRWPQVVCEPAFTRYSIHYVQLQ